VLNQRLGRDRRDSILMIPQWQMHRTDRPDPITQ
jgi:hypothetical protein